MGQTQWGFVRDRGNAQSYGDYRNMGIGGMLYNTEDPQFARGMSEAQQQGFAAGAWLPAHTGEDPLAYARRMNAYSQQYHPAMLVPNVEFQGKGYKGSAGWDWSEKMMSEFRRLNPSQQLAVSVMGNQDDFNYEAYTGRGAQVWSQAYDGAMNPASADAYRQQLIKRGVDPSLINITLAPGGHAGSGGAYSAYTLDDMNPAQRAQYAAEVRAAQGRGASPAQAHESGVQRVAQPIPKGYRQGTKALSDMTDADKAAYTKRFMAARSAAVQTVMSNPPSRARQTARKVIKRR